MFSFFGSNRRRQAQPAPAPPPAQNAFEFAPPDPPRRYLPRDTNKLPPKFLNRAQSVHHAHVRYKALRRIFREKLEGSLLDLPEQQDMENEALKEADKELFFHLRKELFEEMLDFPEPVMRTIYDFQDPQIDVNIVPDLTSEMISFESEVHGELARTLKKSIKLLAKKTVEDNIDNIRIKFRGEYSKGHSICGSSVRIECPDGLDRLLAFNGALAEKMFKGGIEDALCKQWPEFGFTVYIQRSYSDDRPSIVDITLEPPRQRSRARLDDVVAGFDPPPAQSMATHRNSQYHNAFVNSSGFKPCNNCCFCRFHNLKK